MRQFFLEGFAAFIFGTAPDSRLPHLGTKVLLQFVPAGVPRLAQVSLNWQSARFHDVDFTRHVFDLWPGAGMACF